MEAKPRDVRSQARNVRSGSRCEISLVLCHNNRAACVPSARWSRATLPLFSNSMGLYFANLIFHFDCGWGFFEHSSSVSVACCGSTIASVLEDTRAVLAMFAWLPCLDLMLGPSAVLEYSLFRLRAFWVARTIAVCSSALLSMSPHTPSNVLGTAFFVKVTSGVKSGLRIGVSFRFRGGGAAEPLVLFAIAVTISMCFWLLLEYCFVE